MNEINLLHVDYIIAAARVRPSVASLHFAPAFGAKHTRYSTTCEYNRRCNVNSLNSVIMLQFPYGLLLQDSCHVLLAVCGENFFACSDSTRCSQADKVPVLSVAHVSNVIPA
jgi:hypothetical protein